MARKALRLLVILRDQQFDLLGKRCVWETLHQFKEDRRWSFALLWQVNGREQHVLRFRMVLVHELGKLPRTHAPRLFVPLLLLHPFPYGRIFGRWKSNGKSIFVRDKSGRF